MAFLPRYSKRLKENGQLLIELLVTIALVSLMLPALLAGFSATRNGRATTDQRVQALSYLKEAQEAVRITRDNGWTPFINDGVFHPALTNGTWTLSHGSENISVNGTTFTRQITITTVHRDASGTIVFSGGSADPSTKQIISQVSWTTPLPASVTTSSYITRYANTIYTQSSVSDFSAGTLTNITVTNTSGGELMLGSGGAGSDWCDPSNTTIAKLDLNGQGVTKAISAIPGYAYTTTGGNASGYALDSVAISDPPQPSPPVATEVANGNYNRYKAYGVFADNSYAYITTDHPGVTVDIISITEKPFSEAGWFAAANGNTGTSVFVSGTTGFVTAGSVLYSFDLSSKTGSRSQLGSISLAGTGNKVVVAGNYAYVAVRSITNQLQVIDVSNPSSMRIVNTAGTNVQNNQNGVDVTVNPSSTYAYLATAYTIGQNDFFILDITNKASPVLKGSYSTSGMDPTGVAVLPGNRAIVVGKGGQEYQVLNIIDPARPALCGSMSPAGTTAITAVAPVLETDNDAFSYILTDNPNQEFQIVNGGSRASSGVFESATFNAGSEAMFNSFATTASVPPQTTLQFRIAIKYALNGTCTGVTFTDSDFVGIDGTASSYFPSTGGVIPANTSGTGFVNPGSCMRYRAYFNTSDITESPVLYDITFNYSP